MKDRITLFLKNEGISPAEFADKIGVQRSSVSHVLNGRNYPSASFIQKMLTAYKTLNSRWLLLGEGAIFESRNIPVKEPSLFHASFDQTIPGMVPDKSKVEVNSLKESITQPISNIVDNSNTSVIPKPVSTLNLSPTIPESNNYLTDNKEVERIVYFYRDKTFMVYTPSK